MQLSQIFFKNDQIVRAYKNREMVWHATSFKFFNADDVEICIVPCYVLKKEKTGAGNSKIAIQDILDKLEFFLDAAKNTSDKIKVNGLEEFYINTDLTKIRWTGNRILTLENWSMRLSSTEDTGEKVPILNKNFWSFVLGYSEPLNKKEIINFCLRQTLPLSPSKQVKKQEKIRLTYLENFALALSKMVYSNAKIQARAYLQFVNSKTREITKKEKISFLLIKKLFNSRTKSALNKDNIVLYLKIKQNYSLTKDITEKDNIFFYFSCPPNLSSSKKGKRDLQLKHELYAPFVYSPTKQYEIIFLIANNLHINFILSRTEEIVEFRGSTVFIKRHFPRFFNSKTEGMAIQQKNNVGYTQVLVNSDAQEMIKLYVLYLLSNVWLNLRKKQELYKNLQAVLNSPISLYEDSTICNFLKKSILIDSNVVQKNSISAPGDYWKNAKICTGDQARVSKSIERFFGKKMFLSWNDTLISNIDAGLYGIFYIGENKETCSLSIRERSDASSELVFISSDKIYAFLKPQNANLAQFKAKFSDSIKTKLGMSVSLKELYSILENKFFTCSCLTLDGNLNSFQGSFVSHSREHSLLEFLEFIGYFTFYAKSESRSKIIEEKAKNTKSVILLKALEFLELYIQYGKKVNLKKQLSFYTKENFYLSYFKFFKTNTNMANQEKVKFFKPELKEFDAITLMCGLPVTSIFSNTVYRDIHNIKYLNTVLNITDVFMSKKNFCETQNNTISSLGELSTLSFSDEYHWIYPERNGINDLYIQQVYNFSYSNKTIR